MSRFECEIDLLVLDLCDEMMSMVIHLPRRDIFIKGPVGYLPEDIVSNAELLQRFGFESGLQTRLTWIEGRTGIRERRWATKEQACSDLAVRAGRALFERVPHNPSRITHCLLATISGDFPSPPTSPLVLHQLGLSGVSAFDLGAACAGFLNGLQTAACLQEVFGGDQLLIASDIRSKFLNPKDLATSILFGDAAVAAFISSDSANAKYKYLGATQFTDGSVADIIKIPMGGSRLPFRDQTDATENTIVMKDGAALFFKAIEGMEFVCRELLQALNLTLDDIDYLVPHQANLLMIRELAKRLNKTAACVEIVQTMGNTSGTSTGLALEHLPSQFALQPRQKALLVSAGGGGFLAAAVLEVLGS